MSGFLVSYVLRAAIRDRLVISMIILMILAASLSVFFGSAAVNEKDQFAAVFAAGGFRVLNVFGLCLFVVFFIRRSFEAREIEFMLTRPISRISFVLSYALGFAVIGTLSGLFTGACITALSPHLFSQGYILWTLSIIIENIIMMNAAFFFAMILSSAATSAFAVLGLYVLGRMMSQILGILDSGKHLWHSQGMEIAMQLISFFTPRLDLLGQTSWLIYDAPETVGIGFILSLGAIYSALLLAATIIDLTLKKF